MSARPRTAMRKVSTGVPRSSRSAATPSSSSTSRAPACTTKPRDSLTGPWFSSSRTNGTPARARPRAVTSPAGPAPMTQAKVS
ncbi:hypothetical protein H4W80_002018 [Nonomuraea angiospora]|uniref:Uncharacterized protein n=1 Tax=Nonomuraea angiospora TaxID=46172 RepID=A0ABR9LSX6_9ACTN|nr:hypothetical protein [Nonomuraea angiospora]